MTYFHVHQPPLPQTSNQNILITTGRWGFVKTSFELVGVLGPLKTLFMYPVEYDISDGGF